MKREKVCLRQDGTTFPYTHNACQTCAEYMAWMHVSHNPRDGELAPYRPETTLVVNGIALGVNPNPPEGPLGGAGDQCVRKDNCFRVPCDDPGRLLFYDGAWPKTEVREVVTACPTPQPTPSATPPPGPTPTPQAGCPALHQVGGMFLSAVSCGQQCIKQGYLGVRVNYTATETCREGDPGCVCDPARNRCEMPRPCQNPLGADIFLTLDGQFTNDLCDANSDNPFNCHHKPKANETGVTLFTSAPKGADPFDPRNVTNCVDIQASGVRQLPRADGRCQAALRAAGR